MQRYTYISENPFIGMKFHTEVDCTSEYGEVFIEERNGTWNTPYLFNGNPVKFVDPDGREI